MDKGKVDWVYGGNEDQREEDQVVEGRGVVYNIESEIFDFRNMRVLDFFFNKRVYLFELEIVI